MNGPPEHMNKLSVRNSSTESFLPELNLALVPKSLQFNNKIDFRQRLDSSLDSGGSSSVESATRYKAEFGKLSKMSTKSPGNMERGAKGVDPFSIGYGELSTLNLTT